MDIKCKNCGQMIDENDKYCKYCGYLIPQQEETKLSAKQLQEQVLQQNVTINEEDIVGSQKWSLDDLAVLRVGDKQSLYSKSMTATFLTILLGIVFLVLAVLSKILIENSMVAFICLFVFMLSMLVTFGFALERYYNTKGLRQLQDNKITVKKYGFKKPAEVLFNGYVFELVVDKPCPVCEGDIIGDLHIENIEKKVVVVCNINRKHIFQIDQNEFLDALQKGEICIKSKKDKSKNNQQKAN